MATSPLKTISRIRKPEVLRVSRGSRLSASTSSPIRSCPPRCACPAGAAAGWVVLAAGATVPAGLLVAAGACVGGAQASSNTIVLPPRAICKNSRRFMASRTSRFVPLSYLRMTALETRRLGHTDLTVTRLGYGSMELRGPRVWNGRPVDPAILAAVRESGITFVDTSPDYGISEELIGAHLVHRHVLATKCGCVVTAVGDHDEISHSWTREHLLQNIHQSLRKLR